MPSLGDKRAVITGGSTGIGAAIAKKLSSRGVRSLVLDVVPPQFDVEFEQCDVRDEVCLASIAAGLDGLDILVNNAGVYVRAAVTDTAADELDRVVDINFKGTFFCCKHFLPLLLKQRGCVINISSGLGVAAEPESPAYCSTKAALLMLTKCLAQTYGAQGVRVNAVLPGPIDTPLLRNSLANEAELDLYRRMNPMKFIGQPDDVANVVAFLCSEEARYVTGGFYSVDGGESTSSIYSK